MDTSLLRFASLVLSLSAPVASAATLLFHAPFDGSPVAATAVGRAEPIEERGLDWGDGPLPGTRALRVRSTPSGGAAPRPLRLAYSAAGNLPRESGTVALWTRRLWPAASPASSEPWRCLFATPMPGGDRDKRRIGSGALWFWWHGTRLRADQSDGKDRYAAFEGIDPADTNWMHLAFSWRPGRVDLFVNGKRRRHYRDGDSPIRDALAEAAAAANPPDRSWIDRFFVGNLDGAEAADSLISDLRIYDDALTKEEVQAIFESSRGQSNEIDGDRMKSTAVEHWPALAEDAAGRYGRNPLPGEAPGTLAPEALELVDEVRLGEEAGGSGAFPAGRDIRSVGPLRKGALDGAPYLEAGANKGDRFAVRLRLPSDAPLCLIEIDVPDDALRTQDMIVQPCKGGSDYALQVGLLLGGEYSNSGRMLTHRCLYWARTNDVALVAMTAREGAPAAVAAVRAYRVKGDALPSPLAERLGGVSHADSAEVVEETTREKTMRIPRDGGRHVALYFEDPAMNFEFGLSSERTATPEGFADELARLAATMKFTGQDSLFYPGAWYQGLIESGGYNPRRHAPRYREGIYELFDREGLRFVPTINLNNIPWEPGSVTAAALTNGSLHASPIAIHDTGKPNPGAWHNTPPNFNFLHPDVQREIGRVFNALVAEGAGHPSFGGVCLHLTQHGCLWWGSDKSGYNDYCLAAFCRDTGRAPPLLASCREGEREAPYSRNLRGAAYADWLRSDPERWEAWIQWRCDQVTAFYAALAARLAAAHPGAALHLNHFVPPDLKDPDFGKPGFTIASARRRGLDIPALEASIPNLVVMQTSVPADVRWGYADRYFRFDDPARRAAAIDHLRDLDASPDFWSPLGEIAHPWANLHDRYWESAIGKGGETLSCDWLDECPWRVSTLNPGGDHALRHVALPLRFHDALGLSKGGFLVGTYGMEAQLAPFLHAFRSLPPVALPDLPGGTATVKVRGGEWHGTNFLYAVNTGATNATVALPSGPATLAPYSMQVFVQP